MGGGGGGGGGGGNLLIFNIKPSYIFNNVFYVQQNITKRYGDPLQTRAAPYSFPFHILPCFMLLRIGDIMTFAGMKK